MLTRFAISSGGLLLLWTWNSRSPVPRTRQIVFLIASYLFYGLWDLRFLALLIISSLVNYHLGRYLKARVSMGRLWLGIAFNLALLGAFKLPPTLWRWVPGVPGHWTHEFLLPLGISFWTFEALSYLLDVYREENLDPSLLEFCLYMAFFPTVVAGPIARLGNMLPQFRNPVAFNWGESGTGVKRILTGMFMMAASRLMGSGFGPNLGVDAAFARPWQHWSGVDVWFACFGYGFQLFFDFGGYSNLVIGIAQTLGITLPENFNSPYVSQSPSEFWTRWHMSLSSWIRSYVFLPLAMLWGRPYWQIFSLFCSMIAFAMWHKIAWTFLAWGAYQGLLLVIHRLWQRHVVRSLPAAFSHGLLPWLFTFLTMNLGWIFFRAKDMGQVSAMLRAVFSPRTYAAWRLPHFYYIMVSLCVVGYFVVVLGSASLRWLSKRYHSYDIVDEVLGASAIRAWVAVFLDEPWVWAGPIAAVLVLYVSAVLNGPPPEATATMYRVF
jgi:alginate O-acetyltransferase complex protein AlgI